MGVANEPKAETQTAEAEIRPAVVPHGKPSLVILLVAGLAVGWSYGLLEETQELGKVVWWLFVIGAVLLGSVGVAMNNRHSERFRPALKALPLLVAAVCGLTLGHFTAYLLGIDGRSLANYGGTMSWQTNLFATLIMAVLFGSLLGVLAAMLSHGLRRSLPRADA